MLKPGITAVADMRVTLLQLRVYDSLFHGVIHTRMTLRYLAFALAFSVSALGQSPASPSSDQLPDAPSTTSQAKPPAVPTGPTAVIDTTMGRLTCKLYDKQAPVTVANFIGLAEGTKDWTDPKTLKKVHNQPLLQRHHLPSSHSGLHDPGRRQDGHRRRRPRLLLPG